jgi:hypothetical protein
MTMTTMPCRITAGVDTHLDVHVAAALDENGGLLGVESFETTGGGYRQLLRWLHGFGDVELVGVEGTGSYGTGLTRYLLGEGVRVVEVDRPNRQRRRRRGKSDAQDAITAARSAQSGDATGDAKTRDGNVEAMRVLRVARNSARKARTQTLNQMRSLVSTAPESVRAELRDLTIYRLLERASAYRPGTRHDLVSLTKFSLRMLARRAQALEAEVADLDAILEPPSSAPLPNSSPASGSAPSVPRHCSSPPATTLTASATKPPSLISAAHRHSTPAAANNNDTDSTAAVTAKPTPRSGESWSPARPTTLAPGTTSNDA